MLITTVYNLLRFLFSERYRMMTTFGSIMERDKFACPLVWLVLWLGRECASKQAGDLWMNVPTCVCDGYCKLLIIGPADVTEIALHSKEDGYFLS